MFGAYAMLVTVLFITIGGAIYFAIQDKKASHKEE
jgi:hypothetical protein